MAWTRITEGEDVYAVALIRRAGYARALERVAKEDITRSRDVAQAERGGKLGNVAGLRGDVGLGGDTGPGTATGSGGGVGHGLAKAKARQKTRFAVLGPGAAELDGVAGFVTLGDSLWPAALDGLGDTRSFGLRFRNDGKVFARAGAVIVGSRGSSLYGVKITTGIAHEPTDSGINVVSGGAFGIDVVARRGALAADGYTVTVSACGVDRHHPASHADLYLKILRHGGATCSEAPPRAAPYKHHFLPRSQIIVAFSRAIIVVKAPFRSGVISTAHHTMSIRRPVGAFPGLVTSPRSSGCHRLLREGVTCVTQIREILKPMEMGVKLGGWPGPGKPSTPGGLRTERQPALDALDPLASCVCEALPVSRGVPAEKVTAVAGVSVAETLTGLGRLERQGIAARNVGLWKLARKGR